MTSPSVPLKWNHEELNAFNKLQSVFFKSPFVRQPDWNATFYLNTDASAQAISAVLLQKFGEDMHPVSYFSKTLNKAESNYAAVKLELMAIVKAVEAFKSYLYNRHFYILFDSKPLKHYNKTESPTNLVTRWLLTLGEY
jgi:phospholipid-translocating ATPase